MSQDARYPIALKSPFAMLSCEAGRPWPMGASCLNLGGRDGVNFAVHSRHAERIEVCLYDPVDQAEKARVSLPAFANGIWHGFIPGLAAGQLYGLRAHGPYVPALGYRFNPAKLLVDPFARDFAGCTSHLSLERDYQPLQAGRASVRDLVPDPTNNAAHMPKARVLDLETELRAGAAIAPRPGVPIEHAVLYEVHVKGLTQRHPEVPDALCGTYAGLVSAPMLAHFQRLGITTLCLLPVHLNVSESHLLEKGLRNYWGYNTLGYFIPEPGYSSGEFGEPRTEFRYMVDQLHRHGLEVVLDVVYNHSAEGDAFGPTLSWRGLDNTTWYTMDSAGHYLNFSGCGNSFNLAQPCAVQIVMDSLRWWVQAFGVDGFRFDLATVLGRDPMLHQHFHPLSGLLSAIHQDPVLAGIKLIAEPWDVGPGGYKLGQFPPGWYEWNDRFRDTSRAFWLGFDCTRGDFARRLTGSSDCFDHDGRSPLSSINLITSHDGMALADLTSYRYKHNLANGEGNSDGHHHNYSANAGVEGPTSDPALQTIRGQWQRALLVTLLCSQGTPQLLAGDEFGHTQGGNNNAYCQDNEVSWLDWASADQRLTEFVSRLVRLRQAHGALRYARWFRGSRSGANQASCWDSTSSERGVDITWRNADGSSLTVNDWDDLQTRSLVCLIEVADAGMVPTERWLLMFHAASLPMSFALPEGSWRHVLDSAAALVLPQVEWGRATVFLDHITLPPRSVFGLVQPTGPVGAIKF